jgi:hypothetical protein
VIVCASLIGGKESDVNRCETLQSFRRAPNRSHPFSPGAIYAGSNSARLLDTRLPSVDRGRWSGDRAFMEMGELLAASGPKVHCQNRSGFQLSKPANLGRDNGDTVRSIVYGAAT